MNGIDLVLMQGASVTSRKDTYVLFNVVIELQKHVAKLTKGTAICFEFRHKSKKKFSSTKYFPFMEMNEIKCEAVVIELYKKCTDFRRKKLQLLTKKTLHLYPHEN